MGKRTEMALLARGFDSEQSSNLANTGFTLSRLKSMSSEEMSNLGINQRLISQIHSESRPPIPTKILYNVLHKNRRTCCICRNPYKPIIVHHIKEWHISRSHDENNLAVLCLEDHDLVHSRKQLSQNLDEKELRHHKIQWEKDVSTKDNQAILLLKHQENTARWDWINTRRVFELFQSLRIPIPHIDSIDYLYKKNIIDNFGILNDESQWNINIRREKYYFIDFGQGNYIADYLSAILEKVISKLPFIDITSLIEKRTQLISLINNGSYIVAQLPFYYKQLSENHNLYMKKAYYRGYSVRIEFVFDSWYCLSSSAKFDAMSGRKVQTIFGFVREISKIEGELIIRLSCLGAGTAFKQHPARSLL